MERQNEVERLVQEWFQKELDSAWRVFREAVITPGDEEQRYLHREFSEAQIELLGDDWRRGRYGSVPRSLIEQLDCPPDAGSHAYALLASQTLQALGEIHEAVTRWADGKHDYRPEWRPTLDRGAFPPVSVPDGAGMAHVVSAGIGGAPDDTPALGDAIDDYLRSIQRERNPTAKDLGQTEAHLRGFEGVIGKDRTVGSITRRDAGSYFRMVQDLTPNFQKKKELRGLGVKEASLKARRLDLPALNPRTVNSWVGDVRAMFGRLKRTGVLEANPFDGMSAKEAGYTESERGWTPEQMALIFQCPVVMGCASEGDIFTPGNFLLNDWRFWGLVIALTSGARIGELAQLRPIDLVDVGGIWCFDIGRTGGRRTKNTASIRLTPVHSELVRLGLPELADRQKKAGAATLMPGVPKAVRGSHSHQFTNWMRDRLRAHVLPDAGVGQGWHSFRHNFQDFSRDAGNIDSVTDRLAGRAPPGAGGGYGRTVIPKRKVALEKITFPDWLGKIPPRY
ncbi:site-specific integrase [Gluconobacter oxydans]|uniref:site-specific integrase n=1 Tax=Gluconobacter oxydans TaxID=442 RepID=UPI0039EBA520